MIAICQSPFIFPFNNVDKRM